MKFKLNYFVIPTFAIGAVSIARHFSYQGMFWYKMLNLPWYVPPNWLFSIVWTALYSLTTAAAVIVWNRLSHVRSYGFIMILFVLNACANVLWTYIFFIKQNIGLALAMTFLIEASILLLITYLWPYSRAVVYLLLPYAVWVIFAIYMNYIVWSMN